MRKHIFAAALCVLSFTSLQAFAGYKVLTSDEGQQVVFSDTKTLTIFKDSPIGVGEQLGGYFDSSELETKGYDKLEWYYLKSIKADTVEIETLTYDLRLPVYVSDNEKRYSETVRFADGTSSGTFTVHDVKITVTLADPGHITVEILE
jgi:hypothetical protein